jgi:hypothetical protein
MRLRIERTMLFLLILALGAGMVGCKSQKKLARERAEAEYAAMVENAKGDLNAFIDGTSKLSLDAKEDRLEEIKNKNIDDPEVQDLIKQAEEVLMAERSEMMRKEMEAKRKAEEAKKMEGITMTIQDYFSSIAASSSAAEANMFINDALDLFASPDAPVLIIISKAGAKPDYDRPTTILNYLNYLKDTNNNINVVENIKYDDYGKITELELMKKLK